MSFSLHVVAFSISFDLLNLFVQLNDLLLLLLNGFLKLLVLVFGLTHYFLQVENVISPRNSNELSILVLL